MPYNPIGKFDPDSAIRQIEGEQLRRKPYIFYDRVTFEGATRRIIIEDGTIKGFTVSGDIVSLNWNGATSPLSLPDAGASAGYALDPTNGDAQFEGDVYVGGVLALDGGAFRTTQTDSGQRIVISNNDRLRFYTGLVAETTHGYILADATDTSNPSITIQSPSTSATGHYIQVKADEVNIKRSAGTSGTVFNVDANAYGLTATIGPVTITDVVGGSNRNTLEMGTYIYMESGSSVGGAVELIRSHTFRAEDGTSSVPSISFTNDTDTGIQRPTSGQMYFMSNTITAAITKPSDTTLTTGWLGGLNGLNTSTLGGTSGNLVYIASFGGAVNGNNVFIDVQHRRNTTGTGWSTAAIGLIRRTDATDQASVWFESSSVGINDSQPTSAGAYPLVVNGEICSKPPTTGSAATAVFGARASSYYGLWRSTSSKRYKEQVDYDVDYLADVKLRPNIHWRTDDLRYRIGFIAEDLVEEHPLFAVLDEEGQVENYDRDVLVATLAAKVNRLEERLNKRCKCGTISTNSEVQP